MKFLENYYIIKNTIKIKIKHKYTKKQCIKIEYKHKNTRRQNKYINMRDSQIKYR